MVEWGAKEGFATVAGLDQFFGGVKNAFDDREYIPASATQKTSAMVREELLGKLDENGEANLGGEASVFLYDFINTTANMAPSIMASVATTAAVTSVTGNVELGGEAGNLVGSFTMGLSAYGNAKADALRQGYTKEQAETYGLLVGGSEMAMEYLFSGISALGGKATGNVIKTAIDGINNGFLRAATQIAIASASEGFEEAVQEIMTPFFENIATSVEANTFEDINWNDVAYSYVMGALTAIGLEGGMVISNTVKTNIAGKDLLNHTDMMSQLGTSFSWDSNTFKLASEINESTGAYTLGRLMNEMNTELSSQDIDSIKEGLVEQGVRTEDASTIVKHLWRIVDEGATLNASQIAALDNNRIVGEVFRNVVDSKALNRSDSSQGGDNGYRVISQEDVGGISEADIADFNATTGMNATVEEFARAEAALAQDQEALKATYAEREAGGVKYTPPTAKDIKAYETEETNTYDRVLSRKVYMYDGASHAQAEAGFAENGVVYINKNAPVNRNSVAVVLAHEYTHTIEGTAEYRDLLDAVFQSKGYRQMLMSAGEGSQVSITHEEYLQQLIDRYARSGVTIDRAGAEKEAVAKYLSEYLFQNEQHLMELARANPTTFEKIRTAVRRFFARLAGKRPSDADLKKLERLFAKAAKAANTAAQTQKSPATESGVQRSLPSGAQYMMGDDTTDVTSIDMYDQRSYTNFGWVAIHNVLTKMEWGSLRSQFADAVANKYSYPRAKSGEYMIAVGDFSDPITVGKYSYRDRYTNKVIFVSGTMDNPIISQVIEVDHLAPGAVSYYVGGLIKYERTDFDFIEFAESVARQTIFIRRRCEDFPSYSELRRAQQDGRSVQDRDTNRGDQQQRGGSGAPSDGSAGVSYSLPEQSAAETELTPEQKQMQELVKMSKEVSRILERRLPENTPPLVKQILNNIMDELDKLRETPTANAQTTAPAGGDDVHMDPSKTANVSAQKANVNALSAPSTDTQSVHSTPFDVDKISSAEYNRDDVAVGEKIDALETEVAQQQQYVNNVAKPIRIKGIRQDLAGKKHPDTGVPYTERIVTIDGQQYIVVAPEFDSVFDAQLPEDLRYKSDNVQFRRCVYQLRDALEANPELKAQFTEEQLMQIKKGVTPDDFTWHHDVEVGKMQLVSTEIHSKTRHTGGRSLWGGGSKYR